MNKLLSIVCTFWGITMITSCIDAAVVEVEPSQLGEAGTSYFDGTIYEYLEQGDELLKVTFDSLLYLLNYEDPASQKPLRFKELKECLQNENGKYTLLAVPDSCFRHAIQRLNSFRYVNSLKDEEGDLSLRKILEYHKEIEREPINDDDSPVIDVFEYKQVLDTLVCRYAISGFYDTEALTSQFASGQKHTLKSMFYEYNMCLSYNRKPASGFVGVGVKDLTYYDMRNTLQEDVWVYTKAIWTDIYTRNGVIHVLTPGHEFGYGQFIHYFKKYGHEE